MFVCCGVLQQATVPLLDVVFGEREVLPVHKVGLHRRGITGDFLFVPRSEFIDFKTDAQLLGPPSRTIPRPRDKSRSRCR